MVLSDGGDDSSGGDVIGARRGRRRYIRAWRTLVMLHGPPLLVRPPLKIRPSENVLMLVVLRLVYRLLR